MSTPTRSLSVLTLTLAFLWGGNALPAQAADRPSPRAEKTITAPTGNQEGEATEKAPSDETSKSTSKKRTKSKHASARRAGEEDKREEKQNRSESASGEKEKTEKQSSGERRSRKKYVQLHQQQEQRAAALAKSAAEGLRAYERTEKKLKQATAQEKQAQESVKRTTEDLTKQKQLLDKQKKTLQTVQKKHPLTMLMEKEEITPPKSSTAALAGIFTAQTVQLLHAQENLEDMHAEGLQKVTQAQQELKRQEQVVQSTTIAHDTAVKAAQQAAQQVAQLKAEVGKQQRDLQTTRHDLQETLAAQELSAKMMRELEALDKQAQEAGVLEASFSESDVLNLTGPLCSEDEADSYANGMLPASALCPLGVGGHKLRPKAARAYQALAAAYKKDLNEELCITDSYRSYPEQVALKAVKPVLAAKPGTSNHGWGLAVDLCGGIERFGTPTHQWMQEHAGTYGFYHPSWAEPQGSKPEPWHWEYIDAKKYYKR